MHDAKTLREFLTEQDGRPVPPDDLIHMLVPLCEQVISLHEDGFVAELEPAKIGVDETGRLYLQNNAKKDQSLNFQKLSDIQPSTGSALKIVGEYRVTMDGSFGGKVDDLLVFKATGEDRPDKPMFVYGYKSWEQLCNHHDSITDIYGLGLIAAALSCGLDFDEDEDVNSFALNRENLFGLFGGLNPVIASLIQEMTALNRHDRSKDLQLLVRRFETYRDQPISVNIERVVAQKEELNDRRSAVLAHLRDRLFDLSKRNRLIHFRSTQGSVNCTEASVPMVMRIEAIKPNQLCTWGHQFESDILNRKNLQLSKWLRFEDHPYLKPSLDKVLQQSRRDRNEFGFNNLRLIIAFLNWRNLKEAPMQPIKSPLLLISVTLKRKKGVRDQFSLEANETLAEVNPALRYFFRQLYGIKLPQAIDLQETSIEAFHADLAAQINETEPNVTLELQTKPVIELIHQRASQRVRQFQQRRHRGKAQAGFVRPDFSYSLEDYRPLGSALFEKFVRPSPLPQRSAVGVPILPKTEFMVPASGGVAQSETFSLKKHKNHQYDWSIDLTEVTLANLNYKKMSLVQDYNSLIDEQESLPSFDQVFSIAPKNFDIPEPKTLEVGDKWEVVPADATQSKAIAFAKKGHSLIIQGPPGTGKSQTITNLIADYVARGKRVLFVCEKRAALDVVYFRLKQIGLDRLSILVHDSQEDKKAFIHDLKDVYETWAEQHPELDYHEKNRDRTLLAYSTHFQRVVKFETAMHQISDEDSSSLRSILNRRVEYGPVTLKMSAKGRSKLPHLDEWDANKSSVKQIQRAIQSSYGLRSFSDHAYSLLSPEITAMPDCLERVDQALQDASSPADSLEQVLLAGRLPIDINTSLETAQKTLADLVQACDSGLLNNIELLGDDSAQSKDFVEVSDDLRQATICIEEKSELAQNWKTELAPDDARIALEQAQKQEASIFRIFSPSWHKLARSVKANYYFASHASTPRISDVLLRLVELQTARKEMQKKTALAAEKFGVENFNDLQKVRADWKERLPKEKALEDILDFVEATGMDDAALRTLKDASAQMQSFSNSVGALLTDVSDKSLSRLFATIRSMQDDLDDLPDLLPIVETIDQLPPALASLIRERSASVEEIEAIILHETLKRRFRRSQVLREIDVDLLNSSVRRARNAKRLLEDQNADLILARAHANFKANIRTSMMSMTQLTDGKKIFKRSYAAGRRVMENEFRKSMRYKSIRELSDGDSGLVVRDLKPVWLMSPLSVSDTLPLESNQFDVVIFDEASQIPMEDAVPALCRAKQVVVVGDEMQLPPTSFFSTAIADDDLQIDVEEDGEQIAIVLDADSLLSQSARNLPATLLSWHYRSRSESLISFSNAAFYDGRLTTIPDVDIRSEAKTREREDHASAVNSVLNIPITFHKLDHGVYAQRRNTAEATYIAELVRDLLTQNLDKSIGIVAFSEAQQDEIETCLSNLAKTDTKFSVALDEAYQKEEDGQFIGLFVKNLENVQGDERDIIILSICYGPNDERKMRMNFGPINQRGGEKRLNVIFSRAKHHMVVVSSITSEMITNEHNDGARALKTFLSFAESETVGAREVSMSTLATLNPDAKRIFGVEIPLHAVRSQMAAALRERGYIVDEWVGNASLRCDLAIRNASGDAYALGVLIDRDDTKTADAQFERYVFQPGILEAFGWRISDVPSTSWYKDPKSVLAKLESLIASPHSDEDSFDPFDTDIAQLLPEIAKPQAEEVSVQKGEVASRVSDGREFHFTGGTSNKFWRIEQSGCDLTITYGRIGSEGRSMIKTFDTPDRANLQADKLISEKLSKGYMEV